MRQNIKATIMGLTAGALFGAGIAYGNAFKPFNAYEPFHSMNDKKETIAASNFGRGVVGLWEMDGHLVVEARKLAVETGVKQGDVLTHVCNVSISGWVNEPAKGRIDATFIRNGKRFNVALTPSLKARFDFVNESNWVVKNALGLDALDAVTLEPVEIKAGDHLVRACWPVTTLTQFTDAIGDPNNNHLVEFYFTHNGQPYQVFLPKLEANGA